MKNSFEKSCFPKAFRNKLFPKESKEHLIKLNEIHPFFKFTFEKEKKKWLPSLNV